jgi:hypothetical protein
MKKVASLALLIAPCAAACGDNKTHPEHGAYDAGVAAPLSCVPNLDGQLDANELEAVLNFPVKYLINPSDKPRTIELNGTVDANGHRVWNFGIDYADDQVLTIQATALSGKWYASSFPNGQFSTPFDAAGTTDAVYSQDTNGVYLLGLASKDPNPPEGKTLLVYSSPITIFKVPVTVGARWSSTATVRNGTLRGQPWTETDTYDVSDDAAGDLVLPNLTFTQAHKITTKVTIVPAAGQNQVAVQASFVFECFGEVARAKSQLGETNPNFTNAAEVRRFGP